MKFIADGMLGKLTRWLRILGHNVNYSNKLDDAQLIVVAKKERRILLTSDLELYQRATAKGVSAFYLGKASEAERLAQLAKRFHIELEVIMERSRCPKCNTRVKPTSKEEIADKIEKNTFSRYENFWRCPKCGQIYWQGAHWARIRETLETARENLKNLKNEK